MDETKLQEPATSNESAAVPSTEGVAADESSCCAGNAHVPLRQPGVYAPVTVDAPSNPADSQLSDFTAFLKRTWRVWAVAIGAFLGLVLTIAVLQRLNAMAHSAQVKRYDKAVGSLTPDRLIARCGQPSDDVTKEVYPVILRTVRYKPAFGDPLVFTFSKTAEQQSDWVFLTMTDESGAKSFDTPEAKIDAFSCLDSKK
jgi:hypothetical protein